MSVFNSERYLKLAIESILNQTYQNLEFIIINDGSTDDSHSIIKSFNDSRIVYIKEERNKGLVNALNKSLKLAKGEYIARMDADDIALPSRLKLQVDFLLSNEEVELVGTCYEKITDSISLGVRKQQANYKKLKFRLFFGNNIAHPTVMFRRKLIDNGDYYYRLDYAVAQDYELWTRLAIKYNLDNLPLVLLKYRVHSEQVTSHKSDLQKENFKRAHLEYIKNFFEINDKEEIDRISTFFLQPSKMNLSLRIITAFSIWDYIKSKDISKRYSFVRLFYWTFLKSK
jgi:glycosyltransferase involved in cell wall biosynthesis